MSIFDAFPINKSEDNIGLPKTEEYLKNEFVRLANDYKGEDGHLEECVRIAVKIAQSIIDEGGNPQFLTIKGKITNSAGNTEILEPKRYNGRVKWPLSHTVCENNGMIYDPLVGKPLTQEEYLSTTFSKPVEAEIDLTPDGVRKFLQ